MLLVDHVRLKPSPEFSPPEPARSAVAATWRHRERVEHEAADVFDKMAAELIAVGHPGLADRASAAADDERRHVLRCRAIVDACRPEGAQPLAPLPVRPVSVGHAGLDRRSAALYVSVAVGCITETLSCALLLAMRDEVQYAPVVEAIDEIAKDEVEHGRIGWAHLTVEATHGDVGWLVPYIAGMREAALTHDIAEHPVAENLAAYGVLTRAVVDDVVERTWSEVIVPGLSRAGVILT